MPIPLPKFTATVEALERDVLGELQGVVRQLDGAVEAVTASDAHRADQVVASHAAAERRYGLLQQRVLAGLASHRGAPDLQMLASLLHVLRGLRRIAGQSASMARLTSEATGAAREPTALLELVEGAAALSVSGVWLARASFASRDVELAHEVARLDAELARRSRAIQRRAFELGDSGELTGWAMTMLLVGSHAERVSDAAVDVAEQTVVIVNGLFREVAEVEPLPGQPAATW
jgi:phosphate uptake regulator